MTALQRDSDLLWEACDALNDITATLKGRVSGRIRDGYPIPAALIEKVSDLIQRAHDEAEIQACQFALDAALENSRPVPTLELTQ